MSTDLEAAVGTDVDGAPDDLLTIRRNVLLSGIVGGLALLLGLSYWLRGSSAFDALAGLVLLVVAALNLPSLAAARMPVLVADDQGVRFRIGFVWRGLPWRDVRQVVVEHPESVLREGRLVIVPRDSVATSGYEGPLAQAHVRWNEIWYGAPISLPIGITTVIDSLDLAADLEALAAGRAEVVSLHAAEEPDAEPVAEDEMHEEPAAFEAPAPEEPVLPAPVLPLRDLDRPNRVEARIEEPVDLPAWDHEAPIELVVDEASEGLEVVPPSEVPLPVTAVPVIGQKIRHAREMLDMTIDELSQRTRIRPHVLEAMELDDFGPCGGDFYARGHLTAVSRVLGLGLEPLMKTYDEQYAQAPINARRVFEAELSTGLSGGMRATLAGPRWSLVVGAVLSLTMIWGLARMFAGDPEQLNSAPETSTQTAGLAASHGSITSPRMKTSTMSVKAAFAGAHVVVRDRTGKTLWSGDLALGKQRKIIGLAPFKVSSDNAGAISVTVKGKQLGTIGTAGAAGAKTFR